MDDFAKPEEEQPREKFREELHRALESTHRQHRAQNTLGIQRSDRDGDALYNSLGRYTLFIIMGVAIYYIWYRKASQVK